ncbi:hypothetical protein [Akkermansia sp.]|uniref:hypothetical protein n=1 Tax=Akkermansia sp. TaxID=1872421 RepID=UPI0025B9AFEB|nr:hypothetical protein [Akkermansia sp.]MCD8064680.1 hypothetical protein [Akkermansia sp.]
MENNQEDKRKTIVKLEHDMEAISEKLEILEKQLGELRMRADLGPWNPDEDNKKYEQVKEEEEKLRKQWWKLNDEQFFLVNGCTREEAKKLPPLEALWRK